MVRLKLLAIALVGFSTISIADITRCYEDYSKCSNACPKGGQEGSTCDTTCNSAYEICVTSSSGDVFNENYDAFDYQMPLEPADAYDALLPPGEEPL